MIEIKKLTEISDDERNKLLYRYGQNFTSIINDTVIPIVDDIKKRGDKSVLEYTEKFDRVKLENLLADRDEIDSGHGKASTTVLDAFMKAGENIREFHLHQVKKDIRYKRKDGSLMGMIYHPIEKAAIYVPGGKASYPSSVLMGVIPAQIAGVEEITLITPPGIDGKVSDIIMALCKELNIDRIIKAGGIQGITASALGTETVHKSDIIIGPGNIYVTAAKNYLYSIGAVQIDSIAGPIEVLIIADGYINPKWIAFDMLSQAEHDEMAAAILVTTSEKLAEKVKDEIIKDLNGKTGRHKIKEKAISDNGLILISESVEEAIEFSNCYGPEHMELAVKNPMDYIGMIKNAGSLFLGEYAPVSLGDYYSGTNHILPTGGTARFSSGTSVETFLRKMSFQFPTKESLGKARTPVMIMSEAEGFADKHGGSIDIRFKD